MTEIKDHTEILIIDDNVPLSSVYTEILQKAGHSVTVANSGQQALTILDTQQFDIILLDIMMEPMDGWEVLRHIRNRGDCRDTGIIVVTAKSLLSREAMEYGDIIQGFLMKPLSVQELREFIVSVISEREERKKLLMRCGDDDSARKKTEEYLRLNQQIRVWEMMLSIIENTFGNAISRERAEYQDQIKYIQDIIKKRKELLQELNVRG